MKIWIEQRRQAMLQLHLSDEQFYWLPKGVFILGVYGMLGIMYD